MTLPQSLSVFLIICMLSSCSKQEELIVTGEVREARQETVLSGGYVQLIGLRQHKGTVRMQVFDSFEVSPEGTFRASYIPDALSTYYLRGKKEGYTNAQDLELTGDFMSNQVIYLEEE